MTEPTEEPIVLSLPLLKTPQDAAEFAKENFGHVVLQCFTVQANPTFSGSVGTGKYIFLIDETSSLKLGDWTKSL